MRMPFGKFKGMPVNQLPESYLIWLSQNVDLRGQLRLEVEEMLDFDSFSGGLEPYDTDWIKGVYREMARKWHPDRGGSTEGMKAINEFYHALNEKRG